MKNTLTINPGEGCLCECLDRVNDGSNSIYLIVRVGAVMTPKLTLDGEVIYLEPNVDNILEIPESKFTAGAVVGFTYSDSEHTCDTFTITFPDKLEGELSLKRVDNFRYNAQYTTIGGGCYELPVASATTLGGVKVGDTLTISEDGTLDAKDAGGGGSSGDILTYHYATYSSVGAGLDLTKTIKIGLADKYEVDAVSVTPLCKDIHSAYVPKVATAAEVYTDGDFLYVCAGLISLMGEDTIQCGLSIIVHYHEKG